jgi:hypothetical protein
VTSCIAQLNFSFYRSKPIHVDFCGGQISSDAGLLPLRAFDQRHGLTLSLAERVSDPREDERVRHSVLSLFRQRIYRHILPVSRPLIPFGAALVAISLCLAWEKRTIHSVGNPNRKFHVERETWLAPLK